MQEVIQGQIPPCCELPSGTPTGAQCPSGTWQELDDVCSIAQPASPAACDHLCRVGAFGHQHSGVLAALIKLREGRNVGFTTPANLLCSTSTGPCVLKGFVQSLPSQRNNSSCDGERAACRRRILCCCKWLYLG